jgi:copper chaperone
VAETQRAVLNVPGISCDHCRRAIEGAVGGLEGVEGVQVDVDAKSVAVDFDGGTVELSTIKEAIEEEGYAVAGEHTFGA